MITRRSSFKAAAGIAAAAAVGIEPAFAADKIVKIGINLSLTGGERLVCDQCRSACHRGPEGQEVH